MRLPIGQYTFGAVGAVVVGTVDGDPGTCPREHIFVGLQGAMARTSRIVIAQYEEWPSGLVREASLRLCNSADPGHERHKLNSKAVASVARCDIAPSHRLSAVSSATAPCAENIRVPQYWPSFTFGLKTSLGFAVNQLATGLRHLRSAASARRAEARSACTKQCLLIVFRSPSAPWTNRSVYASMTMSGRNINSLGFRSTINCHAFPQAALRCLPRRVAVRAGRNPSN